MLEGQVSAVASLPSRFQKILRIGGGVVAAVAVQPLILLAWIVPAFAGSPQSKNGIGFVLAVVLIAATVAVLLLGVPTFLLLRKLRRDSWAWLAISGALLGALPCALFWPGRLGGDTWLNYAKSTLYFASHGMAGALAFYAAWRWLGRNEGQAAP